MARLVSRAELARIAGVSDVAVSKRCKGDLADACVGKRVDVDHPATAAWLRSKGAKVDVAPTPGGQAGAKRSVAPPPMAAKPAHSRRLKAPPNNARPSKPVENLPPIEIVTIEDIERYAHLSLTTLMQRFGTAPAFIDYLDALKKIEDTREKRLKNDEREGRLIPRDAVKTFAFSFISGISTRLLRDAPKSISGALYARAKSGVPLEEAEAYARERIGEIIAPLKANVARAIRDAGRSEANKDDGSDGS